MMKCYIFFRSTTTVPIITFEFKMTIFTLMSYVGYSPP
uniref:Uncharacterized protein n=1 Tax=Arundo donax TaxID=35708 RepID=A0A0A9C8L6_ARUDO